MLSLELLPPRQLISEWHETELFPLSLHLYFHLFQGVQRQLKSSSKTIYNTESGPKRRWPRSKSSYGKTKKVFLNLTSFHFSFLSFPFPRVNLLNVVTATAIRKNSTSINNSLHFLLQHNCSTELCQLKFPGIYRQLLKKKRVHESILLNSMTSRNQFII